MSDSKKKHAATSPRFLFPLLVPTVLTANWQIIELETRATALQSELDNATPTSLSRRNHDPASWLPKSPPRHALESHRDTINSLAFHPVYSSIATCSDDCTIKIWDWELGELEKTIKGHTRAVTDVDYGGPKGGILLASSSSDLSIKLWDPSDNYKNIRTLLGHDHSVSAIRFVPMGTASASSGNLLVSASRDHSLRIWDVTTGFCVKTLAAHSAWVRDVQPSFDGRFLLSTGDDMTTRLWDISALNTASNTATAVGHDHFIECCALAPPAAYPHLATLMGLPKPPSTSSAAEFFATGSRDKTIRLWDARGTCFSTLVGHDNWVRALIFHPAGRYLLSVSDDKSLRCWDLSQGGKCVRTITDAHERFVTCVRWAPPMVKNVAAPGASAERNGDRPSTGVQIRCVIATGGVDTKLRIFAN